jgi:hypothetical protein
MEKTRINYWVYADIACSAYPITGLDTVRQDGSIDTKSALYIILMNVRKFSLTFISSE